MINLYNYQIDTVRRITRFKGKSLLALDMGLGKTVLSLEWINRNKQIARPCLVVCPASLKYNWEREGLVHFNWTSRVLDGKKAYLNHVLNRKLVIINYDILKEWVECIIQAKFQTIIFDECQYLCNPNSQRSLAAKQISEGVPHILGLSGTPLTNKPSELWSILNIIRPDLYPSFFKFKMRYCDPKKAAWGWNFSGSSNLDELNKRLLNEVMIRKRKSDVLQDLPEKVRNVVILEIKDKKQYNYALKDFIKWMQETNPDKVEGAVKAEGLVKIGYLKRLAAELKLSVAFEWLDSFLEQNDEKIIIFAIHKKIITEIHKKYRKISVVVDGSLSSKEKHRNFEAFVKDKKLKILIGNIKSAGVGWSAKGISNVGFFEMDLKIIF